MDVHTAEQRSRNMAAIKGKDTVPEMFVRRMVHGFGYPLRAPQEELPGKARPRVPVAEEDHLRARLLLAHARLQTVARLSKRPAPSSGRRSAKATWHAIRRTWRYRETWLAGSDRVGVRNPDPEGLADRLVDFLREDGRIGARAHGAAAHPESARCHQRRPNGCSTAAEYDFGPH